MAKMIAHARVAADGVLRLNLTVGPQEANQDVRVTVEPTSPTKTITQEEWAAWVHLGGRT